MAYNWHGQRIVVTGGAGLIGAPLVRSLVARGADVIVLDDFSRGKTCITGAEYIEGDATSLQVCLHALKGAQGLFNLAAHVGGVTYNQAHHSEMFRANFLLQSVPLVAARIREVPRTVQVSSSCVYSSEHNHPALEKNGHFGEPNPANYGYGMAKRVGERMALCLGIEAVIVRPSNAYGLGDYYGERAHVIPALIEKCYNSVGQVHILGTGDEEREFIHCTDAAQGMIAAFEKGNIYSIYNLGTNGETKISIRELVKLIHRLMHGIEPEIITDPSRGGGDLQRWSDSSKAYHKLGWRYVIDLERGLPDMIEDYKQRYHASASAD